MTTTKKTTSKAQSQATPPSFQIPEQVLELQKRVLRGQQSWFDNTYNAVVTMQENQEKAWGGALEQVSFLPSEARELATVWSDNRRAARESYKATVDKSFGLAEAWIDGLSSESRA